DGPPAGTERVADTLLMGNLLGILRAVLLSRWLYYTLAWAAALIGAMLCLWEAWCSFDDGHRADGNSGHTTIDFGGQYLMGRMLPEGHGQSLYDRRVQREVLRGIYPRQDEDQEPAQRVGSCLLPLGPADGHGVVLVLAWGQEGQWKPEASASPWDQHRLEDA